MKWTGSFRQPYSKNEDFFPRAKLILLQALSSPYPDLELFFWVRGKLGSGDQERNQCNPTQKIALQRRDAGPPPRGEGASA